MDRRESLLEMEAILMVTQHLEDNWAKYQHDLQLWYDRSFFGWLSWLQGACIGMYIAVFTLCLLLVERAIADCVSDITGAEFEKPGFGGWIVDNAEQLNQETFERRWT